MLACLLLMAPVTGQGHEARRGRRAVLFDDFSYTSLEAFAATDGSLARPKAGPASKAQPGKARSLSSMIESQPGNRLLRMTASTDGKTTQQAQFCHQRKYCEGTYAARVRFTDTAVAGPDGDQIVETFYHITPLKAPLDPDYSEQDFEYLPNGGWGGTRPHPAQHDLGNLSARA